jgi:diguanylate cyclase (GGDEF)-like protein
MEERPFNVLLVDGDQADTESIQLVLQKTELDCAVQVIDNSEDALDYLFGKGRYSERKRGPLPEIVLIGLDSPGIDGFRICHTLKEDSSTTDIPVVFIADAEDDRFGAEGFAAGGVDYISRPVKPFQLKARIITHGSLKRISGRLKDLNRRDGITGFFNRRSFDESFAHEWTRSIRAQSSLSLILIEVDYFKAYNEKYGHEAGDECLKKVSDILKTIARRASDQLARFEEEIFACVLPETDLKGALFLAGKFKGTVSAAQMPNACSEASTFVTVSVGVASMVPGIGERSEKLMAVAQSKLERARKDGRNRVEC